MNVIVVTDTILISDNPNYGGGFAMTIVQTIEQATQVAIDFVRKYYSFVYPIAARKENSRWIVDLDISYSDRAK